jgi:hypothetical protein
VEALGNRVTKEGKMPSPAHTDALRAMRELADAASLLRFLGGVSFFSKFIPDAACGDPRDNMSKGQAQ